MAFGEEAPPDDAGSRWRRLSMTATLRLVTVMTTLEVRDGDVDSESVIVTLSVWILLIGPIRLSVSATDTATKAIP